MASEQESSLFGVEPGCVEHGDKLMQECSMCGAEFCRGCFPRSTVCPDCVEPAEEDEELDEEEEEEEELDEDEPLYEDAPDGEDEERGY